MRGFMAASSTEIGVVVRVSAAPQVVQLPALLNRRCVVAPNIGRLPSVRPWPRQCEKCASPPLSPADDVDFQDLRCRARALVKMPFRGTRHLDPPLSAMLA